jgi:uncharacterized protein (TIGR02145 family)
MQEKHKYYKPLYLNKMRKIKNLWIYPFILMVMVLMLTNSCKKDKAEVPELTTAAVTNIMQKTANCGGNITSDGEASVTARGVCWSTAQTPTISDNKTTDGSGTGSFVSNITGLTANTTYYVRSYATNSEGTGYGSAVSFTTLGSDIIFNPNLTYGTMTDIDGNTYKTITIGSKDNLTSQTWMAENLKVTRYRNGDPIPYVTNGDTWHNLTTGAYCDYNYTPGNSKIYGHMYNLFSIIDSRNIAPAGWHVPTAAEWNTLINYLGGESIAGGKLKEIGTTHWISPNTGASNSSGLTVLPGGGGDDGGQFFAEISKMAIFWTSTVVPGGVTEPEDHGYYYMLNYNTEEVTFSNYGRGMCGFSVRCVMD